MVVKRHYLVQILDDNKVIDYCYSNTLLGALNYIEITFTRNYNNSNSLNLTFKISKYERNCYETLAIP